MTLVLRTKIAFLAIALLPVSDLNLYGQTVAPATDPEIQTHFAAAQQSQRQNDYAVAEREYQSVIALAPDFAEAHMNLGLVYQLQNRIPDAMTEFRLALKFKPTLAGANFFLGVDHCKMGEGAKAIPYLNAALKAQPNQPEIWLWLGTAQEVSGNIAGEVATMRRAVELHPKDVDLLYLLGHAYERMGKLHAARLENGASDSSRKEQFLAESYAASNEWPSAVIHFQNAAAASPNRPGLHVEFGEVLLHAGKISQASHEFNEELRIDPNNLRALVRKGETELIQENDTDALKDWTRAIAIDQLQVERILGLRETGFGDSGSEQLPSAIREKLQHLSATIGTQNSPSAELTKRFLAVQSGDPSQLENSAAPAEDQQISNSSCSEAELEHLLLQGRIPLISRCARSALTSRSPAELRFQVINALLDAGESEAAFQVLSGLPSTEQNSEASYWRARCYEKLATAAYLRLYETDPNSYRLHQLMGDIDSAKGDDGAAIEEYRAAIALKPSLPNLHYSLGHLLWKDLKVPEARQELEAELVLNPHHAGSLNDLGETYLLEHQPEKALSYLNRSLAADPNSPDIHRDLGTAYSELGDYQKAAEQLKLAVADDHDGSVHYRLARAYQALGNKQDAAREFALSTALNRESHSKLEKQTERLAEITKQTQEP